jgi:hypothetical protein
MTHAGHPRAPFGVDGPIEVALEDTAAHAVEPPETGSAV